MRALLLALVLPACAGSFEEARGPRNAAAAPGAAMGAAEMEAPSRPDNSERCQALDSKRTNYGAVAKGTAVLAGAGALSTIPDESQVARITLASSALLASALAAFAIVESEGAGESWARECSQ